jgi:hypothetical protein
MEASYSPATLHQACRGASTVRNSACFLIRSLIPQPRDAGLALRDIKQTAGSALAVQYNYRWLSKKVHIQGVVLFQERGQRCRLPSL